MPNRPVLAPANPLFRTSPPIEPRDRRRSPLPTPHPRLLPHLLRLRERVRPRSRRKFSNPTSPVSPAPSSLLSHQPKKGEGGTILGCEEGWCTTECRDLKVYGLEDKHMYVVDGRGKPREMEWINWVQGLIVAWLSKRDAEVVSKAPRIYGGAFRPLVLSAGGLMSEETAVDWQSWRKGMEKEVWHGMQSRVGIELVKARGRTMWK
ncbi:hypothetical protein I350_04474 [Cryptococcus amylolentus CBS 6273]|uniref:Uncharacterized protein n=1 Tax=Cryptococcus amylolentus CBS 6273 TaxID=1296118 RepID=A0A1E3K239_9TREE|nr:hypothetical protein I350_04474 [Cryptococcus amylolentus CBS 6273]